MRKFIIVTILCLIGIGIATSYATGQERDRQRQMIQQSCEADLNCTYVQIHQ
jgi:hypothetical protein